jgi:hypothetical protein
MNSQVDMASLDDSALKELLSERNPEQWEIIINSYTLKLTGSFDDVLGSTEYQNSCYKSLKST